MPTEITPTIIPTAVSPEAPEPTTALPSTVSPGALNREQALSFLDTGDVQPNRARLNPSYSETILPELLNNFEQNKWILDELTEEHFGTFGGNRDVFRAIIAVARAGEAVGMPTVLARFPVGSDVGSRDFIEKCIETWPTKYAKSSNLRAEVNAIKRQLNFTKIGSVLDSAKKAIESCEKEPQAIALDIANKLDAISATVEIPNISQPELNALTLISLTTEPFPAYSTGFFELDKRIGGLSPKRTYVIGARTGQGKSAFLLNMLAGLGRRDVKSAFISLEMDQTTMNKRLCCIVGGIESSHLKYGLTPETLLKLQEVHGQTGKWPLYWCDKRGMTLEDLKTKISQFARMGCKVIFVDYIQRVLVSGKDAKHIQVGQIAKTLADLADRLNVAIVVASQMNREGGKMEGGPELHHIAESTVIEESADVILLLSFKKKEDESQGRNRPARVNIAKNRHGFGGSYDIYFCGRQFKFSDTPFELTLTNAPLPKSIPTPPAPCSIILPSVPSITERTEVATSVKIGL